MWAEIWTWMTTDTLGMTITGGVVSGLILTAIVWFFKSPPPPPQVQQTNEGDNSNQATGEHPIAARSDKGDAAVHSGNGNHTEVSGTTYTIQGDMHIHQGIPQEKFDELFKRNAATEKLLSDFFNTLKSGPLGPDKNSLKLRDFATKNSEFLKQDKADDEELS